MKGTENLFSVPFFMYEVVMYPTSYFESIDSTNIKARELAEQGGIAGTAVVASYQTKGRGRLGKKWCSVDGKGLYCSIIVRPDLQIENFPKITLVAGLAVAKVLDRLSSSDFQLKWPNDVYHDGKKVAGILTESSSLTHSKKSRFAIVGIGINVHQQKDDFPPDLQPIVTSLSMITGHSFDIKELFQAIRLELFAQLDEFETHGFTSLLGYWREKDFLKGKEMVCVDVNGSKVHGVGQGVDQDGQLYVKDGQGRLHEVLSGDVSLAL